MTSPRFGVASLTTLVTARSDFCGVTVVLAVLLLVSGSNWSAAVTLATFVTEFAPVTRASRVRTAWAPDPSEPTFQAPVALAYVPWLGAAETNVKPAGSRSLRRTPVAPLGP